MNLCVFLKSLENFDADAKIITDGQFGLESQPLFMIFVDKHPDFMSSLLCLNAYLA